MDEVAGLVALVADPRRRRPPPTGSSAERAGHPAAATILAQVRAGTPVAAETTRQFALRESLAATTASLVAGDALAALDPIDQGPAPQGRQACVRML